MLTLDDLRALASDIDYRPNGGLAVGIAIRVDADGLTYMDMAIPVRNSRRDENTTILTSRTLSGDDMMDASSFVKFVLQHACWFAAHEACEWFRFEDTLVADPHVMASPDIRIRRVNIPPKPGRL